ncbi:MAG: TIGR03792 family protein [Actinomycetes bacterium]
MSGGFVFVSGERRPVEVLVFRVEPERVEEFLRVDHEVWTLGEALLEDHARIPFLSKEVWLDDSRPGEVTLVFVWETMEQWDAVGRPDIQARLQAEFDARFPHPVTLVRAPHEDSDLGIHRVSRFERTEERP